MFKTLALSLGVFIFSCPSVFAQLQFSPPQGWQEQAGKQGIRVFRSANGLDAEVLVFPLTACSEESPGEPLQKFVQRLEQGRSPLPGSMSQAQSFYTAKGLPVTSIVRFSKGDQPPLQFMQAQIYTVGCGYQLVTLLSGNQNSFVQSVKVWENSFTQTSAQISAAKAHSFPSRSLRFFNYTLQIPQRGEIKKGTLPNQILLDFDPKIYLELEQAHMPAAPLQYLRYQNLTYTSLLPAAYKSYPVTLDAALSLPGMGGPGVLAQWTVRSKDNSPWFLTASALVPFRAFRLRLTLISNLTGDSQSASKAKESRFQSYVQLLPSLLATLKWQDVKRRPDLEAELIRRKSYRYSRYSQSSNTHHGYTSNTTTSVSFDKVRNWIFHANQTATVMDYTYTGVNQIEMGPHESLLGSAQMGRDAGHTDPRLHRFSVWQDPAGAIWLIASRPGGQTRFHQLQLGPQLFALDGDNQFDSSNQAK